MKSDELKEKQERCEAILGKMNEREFGNLVELGKQITDFDTAEVDGREGAADEEQDDIMTFNMDVESEEEILDEIASEDNDEDNDEANDEAAAGDSLNAGRIKSTAEEEEDDEGSLRVEDIDSFWLQRQIHEYEPDAEKSQRLAEEMLSILQSSDERGDEDRLVELIGVEHAAAGDDEAGCGNCSNCTTAYEVEDVTEIAREAVRFVQACGGRFAKRFFLGGAFFFLHQAGR